VSRGLPVPPRWAEAPVGTYGPPARTGSPRGARRPAPSRRPLLTSLPRPGPAWHAHRREGTVVLLEIVPGPGSFAAGGDSGRPMVSALVRAADCGQPAAGGWAAFGGPSRFSYDAPRPPASASSPPIELPPRSPGTAVQAGTPVTAAAAAAVQGSGPAAGPDGGRGSVCAFGFLCCAAARS